MSTFPSSPVPLLAVLAAAVVAVEPATSQDVEMLGRRYGTRPPQAYYDALARDSLAFQFTRGRTARMRAHMAARARAGPPRVLGPRDGPVVGTVGIPVVLGLFSDSPVTPAFGAAEVAEAYFGAGEGTVTAYYDEVSGGRVTVGGDLYGWVRSARASLEVTGGQSGLQPGQTGPFIVDLLEALGGAVDWGAYDNDGPDGIPNSGDDDGFVDALAVFHPTPGAECGGSETAQRIWSHKWSLQSAAGGVFTTGTGAASGGFIKIDDYFIQGTLSCDGTSLAEIGIFTHESGHAFGLPDLYDTRQNGAHSGIGAWGLMGSGAWGCDGHHTPEAPCHMSPWSKEMLGWADVTVLAPGLDHGTLVIPPVESTGAVYRVEAGDGSGGYYLLENREPMGFDQSLLNGGLLIWQIAPAAVAFRWGSNSVNSHDQMGVWLRQADGLDELGQVGGGRGDRDDVYPFTSATRGSNDAFHAGSNPAARSPAGTATGLTVTEIQRVGDDVSLELSTRFTGVTLRTVGDAGSGGLLTVDGVSVPGTIRTFPSAPFEAHEIEAAPGEPVAPGRRLGFEGWDDDAAAPRIRSFVTPRTDAELVARYGTVELEMAVAASGGINGVEPGSFSTQPFSEDLWFEEGVTVSVEAVAQTGFDFLRWTGDLQGQPNPTTITLTAPVAAGADFELTYAVPTSSLEFPAARTQSLQLQVENGTLPVFWRLREGKLPPGLYLSPSGLVSGAALDMGSFPATLEAQDALGLTAQGTVTFQVGDPGMDIDQLASDFLSVGPPLDSDQRKFLDRQGNADGIYDLGDLRAWVLAHPELPLSATLRAVVADLRPAVVPATSMNERKEGGS